MLTHDLINAGLSRTTVDRGRDYQRSGAVTLGRVEPGDTLIAGEVKGTRLRPYSVTVRVEPGTSTRRGRIDGRCSCPMSYDCKHVAALLLAVLAARESGRALPQPLLSAEAQGWLTQLAKAGRKRGEDYPRDIRQRLIYLLSIDADFHGMPRLVVQPTSVQLRKDGSRADADPRPIAPGSVQSANPAKYLRDSDLRIMALLRSAVTAAWGVVLAGPGGTGALSAILSTGRCRWRSLDGPALSAAGPCPGEVRWAMLPDGRQQPRIEIATPGALVVPALSPPWFISPQEAVCGPIDLPIPLEIAEIFLKAPPLSPTEVAVVRARLPESLGAGAEIALPLPSEVPPPRRTTEPPVPRLIIRPRTLTPRYYWYGGKPQTVWTARLSFLYEGLEVDPSDAVDTPLRLTPGGLVEVVRLPKAEKAAVRQLADAGFEPAARVEGFDLPGDARRELVPLSGGTVDEIAWIDFVDHRLPRLQEQGWRIEIAEGFPYNVARMTGEIEAELEEGPGIDWFDLSLGVEVDGTRIDILPALLRHIRKGSGLDGFDGNSEADIVRLRLDDGRFMPVPFDRIRPILQVLANLFDSDGDGLRDGPIRLHAADAGVLNDSPGVVWRGGDRLRDLARRLRSDAAEVTPPATFLGALRPYQQAGLNWLQLLRGADLGGILADDMSLGKTVQVLAHVAVEKAEGRLDRPCLVVAPTSLLPNWRAEAGAFTPSLTVHVHHGTGRKEAAERLGSQDVVITSYPLLARDAALLGAQPWHMVILDEAQFVKNAASGAAKALRQVETRHRLALTGTPLENHLGELWSLFDFVSPGLLGDARAFARLWRTPIEKRGDRQRQAKLALRVRPFLLRRTKAQVATELPPKMEIVEPIELGEAQRQLYDGVRLAMHAKVREAIAAKGLRRSHIELLDALLKLRQACCDPRLVKSAKAAARTGSAKLERLIELLTGLIEEGRRILLFSQFTSMLDLIEPELTRLGIPFVRLTGETKDRATPVARFQAGEVPLFLISLKAGGTGLNLTAADTVIHYDPWWNPAVEAQATDRAHRIGQDKPVFVYKLIALNSIEVKMAELKARKQALADGLFDPGGRSALDITEADIDFLLGDIP